MSCEWRWFRLQLSGQSCRHTMRNNVHYLLHCSLHHSNSATVLKIKLDLFSSNDCYYQSCNNRGSCTNHAAAGSFTCSCQTGYTGSTCGSCATSPVNYIQSNSNPFTCVINYCHGQTCSNAGTCNNGGSGYTCSCNTGYVGKEAASPSKFD